MSGRCCNIVTYAKMCPYQSCLVGCRFRLSGPQGVADKARISVISALIFTSTELNITRQMYPILHLNKSPCEMHRIWLWELIMSYFGARLGWNAMFLSRASSSVRQHGAKPRSCRWPELKSPEMPLLCSLLWNSRKSLTRKEQAWESWFKEQLDTRSSLEMAQNVQWLCLRLEHSKQAKDRHLAVHPQESTLSLPNRANSYHMVQNWLKLSFWCCIQHDHC